jgi:hypothetical protein
MLENGKEELCSVLPQRKDREWGNVNICFSYAKIISF